MGPRFGTLLLAFQWRLFILRNILLCLVLYNADALNGSVTTELAFEVVLSDIVAQATNK